MRPRVFPAEDPSRDRECAPDRGASMRPRVFPAEDLSACDGVFQPYFRASMRPRVFPAEDSLTPDCVLATPTASMRPRVFPAEDGSVSCGDVSILGRFNEAAGIPRGRRRLLLRAGGESHASMRPRVFPAEDELRRAIHHRGRGRFNEAAGIPRGRHFHETASGTADAKLQ